MKMNFCRMLPASTLLSKSIRLLCTRQIHYVQGQYSDPKTREYFYYIDHQGQLFLDDARMKNFTSCFKEKKFLEFFFKRLKLNDSGSYAGAFPYLSPCGKEKNYVRCDDLPVVFTQVIHGGQQSGQDLFSYCNGGDLLTVPFEPDKVCMLPESGRVYHPAPERCGGVGLVKSQLAIEFSKDFEFGPQGEEAPPVHFTWKGVCYHLKNDLIGVIHKEVERKKQLEKQFGSYAT